MLGTSRQMLFPQYGLVLQRAARQEDGFTFRSVECSGCANPREPLHAMRQLSRVQQQRKAEHEEGARSATAGHVAQWHKEPSWPRCRGLSTPPTLPYNLLFRQAARFFLDQLPRWSGTQ